MGAIDHLAIVTLGADDARAGFAIRGSALESERGRLAIFSHQGTVFGVRDGDGSDRNCCAAALHVEQCVDQHGAGYHELATPRPCDETARCLPRCRGETRATTWLDATPAGATVYGPLGFGRRWNCADCASRASAAATAPKLVSESKLDEMIARDRRAMCFDRDGLLRELSGRSGSQLVSHGSAIALIRDGRTASTSDRCLPMMSAPPPR